MARDLTVTFASFQVGARLARDVAPPTAETISGKTLVLVHPFSPGTAHGFFYVYNHMCALIRSDRRTAFDTVLMYAGTCGGIKQIVEAAHACGFFGKGVVRYVAGPATHFIEDATLLANENHQCVTEWEPSVRSFVDTVFPGVRLGGPSTAIAILKTTKTKNSTLTGVIPHVEAEEFCARHGLMLLDPTTMGELQVIAAVGSCTSAVFSYGTAWWKNKPYIGESCQEITVVVRGGCNRVHRRNPLLLREDATHFSGCPITYIDVGDNVPLHEYPYGETIPVACLGGKQ